MTLANENCTACRADSPRVEGDAQAALLSQTPGWVVKKHGEMPVLTRTYDFANFALALSFTNRVGGLAEQADHHPEIVTEWGKVKVTWWTHTINGLHRNDFISAARCNDAFGD